MEGLRLRVGGPAGVEGDFPISGTPSDSGANDSSEGHAFDSPRERTQNQAEEAEELESPDRPINAIHFASELLSHALCTCVTRTRSSTSGLCESPPQGL